MWEFMQSLLSAADTLRESEGHAIAVLAGCDLFQRFFTRNSQDVLDFESTKTTLTSRGSLILTRAALARDRLAELGALFLRDGAVVLCHSYSRAVVGLLLAAARQHKRFKVYVTEASPQRAGLRLAKSLRAEGIPVSVILDAAVGYVMQRVDLVLAGAEGVVENGGIINQLGTYQVAVVARDAGVPFYAVAESYKFVRLLPLSQYDLPSPSPAIAEFTAPSLVDSQEPGLEGELENYEAANPTVDYTPPEYITLLFTDLGVLTPSGVSDELIKLYL
jgi:translation initiation factor eIF-2B subunit alpha